MLEFKIGYKVRRIRGFYRGMKIGDIGTMESINTIRTVIKITEYGAGHDIRNFVVVSNENCPNIVIKE